MVSAPALPNVSIEPVPAARKMLSFSEPPNTLPVLPDRVRMLSLPELPNPWTRPVPLKMQSSPARPTMVPGPVSPV